MAFGVLQAAKEFESELKTEPEDSVADSSSSPLAMSKKEEEKTEVPSSSKENV